MLEEDPNAPIENPEKRLPTNPNEENESQFSMKHFQYDAREREMLRARIEAIKEVNGSITSKVSKASRSALERANSSQVSVHNRK